MEPADDEKHFQGKMIGLYHIETDAGVMMELECELAQHLKQAAEHAPLSQALDCPFCQNPKNVTTLEFDTGMILHTDAQLCKIFSKHQRSWINFVKSNTHSVFSLNHAMNEITETGQKSRTLKTYLNEQIAWNFHVEPSTFVISEPAIKVECRTHSVNIYINVYGICIGIIQTATGFHPGASGEMYGFRRIELEEKSLCTVVHLTDEQSKTLKNSRRNKYILPSQCAYCIAESKSITTIRNDVDDCVYHTSPDLLSVEVYHKYSDSPGWYIDAQEYTYSINRDCSAIIRSDGQTRDFDISSSGPCRGLFETFEPSDISIRADCPVLSQWFEICTIRWIALGPPYSLPTPFKATIVSNPEKETCAVCLQEFTQDQEIWNLLCHRSKPRALKIRAIDQVASQSTTGHCFHESCLKESMKFKDRCPICRSLLSDYLYDALHLDLDQLFLC